MKLPRDLSSADLARALRRLGCEVTRPNWQPHPVTTQGGQHHLTIPLHRSVSVGTLAAILSDVARHLNMTRQELVQQLFRQ